jgi:uncharacterized damage-inducible protein DinB
MSVSDDLLVEFREELKATRRVLDRIPADKLTWKPHEKSMSLGQLAMHTAGVPGSIAAMTAGESFDLLKADFTVPSPAGTEEIQAALNESAETVEKTFKATDDETAYAQWRLLRGDAVLMAVPRVVAWRSLMLNHWYHHRGQLTVYLRLLDVPLPSLYGPSADENPFG